MIKDSSRLGSPESSCTGDLPRLTASNSPEENITNIATSSKDSLEHRVPTLTLGHLELQVIQLIIDFLVKRVLTFSLPIDVRELQKYVHQESGSHLDPGTRDALDRMNHTTDRRPQYVNSSVKTVQCHGLPKQPRLRVWPVTHRMENTLHISVR